MSLLTNKSFRLFLNIINKTYKNHDFSKIYNAPYSFRTFKTSLRVKAKRSFILADIGEGIREVTIEEWFVKEGDKIAQFDKICEVQSDKASVTITSKYDGVISKIYYKTNEIAKVGQPLIDVETDDEINEPDEISTSELGQKQVTINDQNTSYKKYICIPSVRRLLKENNIQTTQLIGSGKDGRILKEDVLKYLKPSNYGDRNENKIKSEDRIIPIQGIKKAMFKSMTEARNIPQFGYCDELIVTNLSNIRQLKEFKDECISNNIKISFMPFFIKAISNALHKYPIFNALLDESHENIIYKSIHNIGIGMDSKIGLIVPVIKNVEQLTIIDIAKELNRLMIVGKGGNINSNDLTGGTFTLSNVGTIGGTYVSPIILPPQVAIIAIGQMKTLPRFDKTGNVVAEKIIYLSAAADHRIIDGASMGNFINLFKKQIEQPYLLFLNL